MRYCRLYQEHQESSIYYLSHTQARRGVWFAIVCHSAHPKTMAKFTPLAFRPWMAVASSGFQLTIPWVGTFSNEVLKTFPTTLTSHLIAEAYLVHSSCRCTVGEQRSSFYWVQHFCWLDIFASEIVHQLGKEWGSREKHCCILYIHCGHWDHCAENDPPPK